MFLEQLVSRSAGQTDSSSRPFRHCQAFRKGYRTRTVMNHFCLLREFIVHGGNIARRLRFTQLTTYTAHPPTVSLRARTWLQYGCVVDALAP